MKSALFVDFDNIYTGLRQLDPVTADRFARSPMTWVNWMVSALALPEHVDGSARRRILVRRCYLNPQAYQRFRPFFNLAGFEIIDCPALTSGGKTSTDIHMVLDIIDLLQHEAHYDEFIVLSADADFTPVLRKLRRWDRRTTVLAIGFPSAAYRASADLVIDQDEFVRDALTTGRERSSPMGGAPPPAAASSAAAALPDNAVSPSNVLAAMAAEVRQAVCASSDPVLCSQLASLLRRHSYSDSDWQGHGTFRSCLEAMPLADLAFDWHNSGGVVYDPARHKVPSCEPTRTLADDWRGQEAALAIARQIHEVTSVPLLSPLRYAALFSELSADLDEHGYDFLETVKRVRDRCRLRMEPVSRADLTFILRGIVLRGHLFKDQDNSATVLGQQFCNNVRSLCLREQIQLDNTTESSIRRWILSSLLPPE